MNSTSYTKRYVYRKELKEISGIDCQFPDIVTIAYSLKNKGYNLTDLFSDGFALTFEDPNQAFTLKTDIRTVMTNMLSTNRDEDLLRLHKRVSGIYLSAMHEACLKSWNMLGLNLSKDDIHYGGDSEHPEMHFSASIK